jgi:predicted dienelactone hydrolase
MRPLEVVLLTAALLVLVDCATARRTRAAWLRLAFPAAVLVALAQWLLEGFRPQLVPAIGLVLVGGVLAIVRHTRSAHTVAAPRLWCRLFRGLGVAVGALAWLVAAALPALLPVFALPAPSGPHRIGTSTLALAHPSREEPFTADLADRRELLIKLWYPAEPQPRAIVETCFAPSNVIPRELATALGLPRWFFDHLRYVRTHAVANAPAAIGGEKYPIVVFSHGYGQGFPSQNQVLCEELASHGYVVASVGHPLEALILAYPDGYVVRGSQERQRWLSEGTTPLVQQFLRERSPTVRRDLLQRLRAPSNPAAESLAIWSDDTRTAVDWLARVAAGEIHHALSGRLDTSRLGAAGMSFGGATAASFCAVDPRCKAAVNLDGFQFGSVGDGPLPVPFMVISGAAGAELTTAPYGGLTGPYLEVVVDGATHFDFTDFPLISPLFRMTGVLGSIDGRRAVEITARYTRSFFDRFLRGDGATLVDAPSPPYPEVRVTRRGWVDP